MKFKEQYIFDLFKVAEIEIIYNPLPDLQNRPVITEASIAYEIFRNHWNSNKIGLQEQFKILLLNQRGACIGISEIATGGKTSCVVDKRLVFATALKANANSIILAHNHPSGGLQPSEADISLTKSIAEAGKLMDIPVLDHLILTPQSYLSFSDAGLMPV
ncbi:MAG: DNA repair protein [Bacteroidetes bacterium 47-18]|nr:MAG: DNA repair protein [Bacteroidetes bacterium 47-18]